jgi:hypothetical protein
MELDCWTWQDFLGGVAELGLATNQGEFSLVLFVYVLSDWHQRGLHFVGEPILWLSEPHGLE